MMKPQNDKEGGHREKKRVAEGTPSVLSESGKTCLLGLRGIGSKGTRSHRGDVGV